MERDAFLRVLLPLMAEKKTKNLPAAGAVGLCITHTLTTLEIPMCLIIK